MLYYNGVCQLAVFLQFIEWRKTMVTIDNYSFVCIENTKMRLAKPNEMNDSRRKIVIVGTCDNGKEKSVKVIEVQHYEKTYIIGNYNSYNSYSNSNDTALNKIL